MLRLFYVLGLLGALSRAAPVSAPGPRLGLKFDKRSSSLPTLALPDATYQAASYDLENDVG